MRVKSKFAKGLLIYSAVLLVLTLMVWFAAWTYAAAYEKAQPKGAMNAYVENTLKTELAQQIADYSEDKKNNYQSAEEITAVLTEKLMEQDWTFRKNKRYSTAKPVYTMYCGDLAVGEVELQAGVPGALSYELAPWLVKSADYDLELLEKTVTVYAPADCQVTLNGKALPATETTAAHFPLFDAYTDLVQVPMDLLVYTVPELAVDTLEIKAAAGHEVYMPDEAGYVWYIIPEADEKTMTEITEFAPKFVEGYLKYTSNSGTFYSVMPYVAPGGELIDRLRRSLDGMSWVHYTTGTIEAMEVSNVKYFGNGFTFDASYDLKIKSGDMAGNMHVTVVKQNNGWRVVDFEQY